MYSPKIDEELIPLIYGIAKVENKPMTEVVNGILRKEVKKLVEEGSFNERSDSERE